MATNVYQREFQRLFMQSPYSVASSGFMGAFFGRANGVDQTIFSPNNVDIVIPIQKTKGLTRADFVKRGTDTNQKNTIGMVQDYWSEMEMKFPLIEADGYISSDQLVKRLPTEVPSIVNGQSLSRSTRKSLLYQKLSMNCAKEVFSSHIYVAAQSILFGYQPAVLDTTNPDERYSWQRDTDSIVSKTGSEWNQAGADIAGDIGAGCDWVRERGKKVPDVMILDGKSFKAMVDDADTVAKADNRRYTFHKLGTNGISMDGRYARLKAAGFAFMGVYTSIETGDELNVFIYKGFYNLKDTDNTAVNIVPDGTCLICSYEAETARYFGPPDMFDPNAVDKMWMQSELGFSPNAPLVDLDLKRLAGDGAVFDPRGLYAYVDGSMKTRHYLVQSAPLYVPTDVDPYYTLTDLIS